MFQVYNSMKHHLHTALCVHCLKQSLLLSPSPCLCPPPSTPHPPFLLANTTLLSISMCYKYMCCYLLNLSLVKNAKGSSAFHMGAGWFMISLNIGWSHTFFKAIPSPTQFLQRHLKKIANKISKVCLFYPYFKI